VDKAKRAHRLTPFSLNKVGTARSAPLPTLVIGKSDIVRTFREEWPAVDRTLRQAADDRIAPTLSSLRLSRSRIVVSASSDPDGCRNNLVRFTRQGSTKMTKTSTVVAGIDTAKDKLDIAVHGQTSHWQVENTLRGWKRLRSELAEAGVVQVGIEATGGYERGVVSHLRAAGFTVMVLQPIQVRAFARVHLRRAKNDMLDAVLIAACAAAIEKPRIEPDQRLTELADLLTFVEQIEEDIARLKTRLEHINEPRLRRMVLGDIARLKARRLAQIRLIAKQIRHHHDLATRSISC
jgi:transposase